MNQHTFVFADVHGTKVPPADLAKHLRQALTIYGGEYVDTIGDAVMLRLARATDAVTVSLDAVDTFTRHGHPAVRVGLDTGSGVLNAGRWSGPAALVAARVAEHAQRGQVIATSSTRQATDRGQIDFIGIGEHTLHDAGPPVSLYRAQRVTDVGPPGRLDIDPVCHLAVDATQAVRIPGNEASPAFCSQACAETWSARHPGTTPPSGA
ncbi:adenylate/guanylate cyclase domain-containing protein [Patulibacter sp. NPDC049589]|uniref:adenylate/guanylate cyclase domain-containing protein n=1 Tax=Patulibacter sp. NPDC049589 TaxID=3154731 RepID=UPI00343ACD70